MNFTTKHGQAFTKLLGSLDGYGGHPLKSFDKFLGLASLTMRQGVHKLQTGAISEAIEAEYMKTIGTVKNPEVPPQMFAELMQGLEVPHDFLGEIYMVNELGNKHSGQFFTPFSLSQIMVEVTFGKTKPKAGQRLTLNDPACGSGSTLIAGVEKLMANGFGQNEIFVTGQDIDLRCVQMCYLHFSLLDIPGKVDHCNTLSLEQWDSWETIGYARNPFPHPDFSAKITLQETLAELF